MVTEVADRARTDVFIDCVKQVMSSLGCEISHKGRGKATYLIISDAKQRNLRSGSAIFCFDLETSRSLRGLFIADDSRLNWQDSQPFGAVPFFREFVWRGKQWSPLSYREGASDEESQATDGGFSERLYLLSPGSNVKGASNNTKYAVGHGQILPVSRFIEGVRASVCYDQSGQFLNDFNKPFNRSLLTGLPGAGKTKILNQLAGELLLDIDPLTGSTSEHGPINLPIVTSANRCLNRNLIRETSDVLKRNWGISLAEDAIIALIRAGYLVLLIDDIDLWAQEGDLDLYLPEMQQVLSVVGKTGSFVLTCGSNLIFHDVAASHTTLIDFKSLGKRFLQSLDLLLVEMRIGRSLLEESAKDANAGLVVTGTEVERDKDVFGKEQNREEPENVWPCPGIALFPRYSRYAHYLRSMTNRCWPGEASVCEEWDTMREIIERWLDDDSDHTAFCLFGHKEREAFLTYFTLFAVNEGRVWTPVRELYEEIFASLGKENRKAVNVNKALETIEKAGLFKVNRAAGMRFKYQTVYERNLAREIARFMDKVRSATDICLETVLSKVVVPARVWDIVLDELAAVGMDYNDVFDLLIDPGKGPLESLQESPTLRNNILFLITALAERGYEVDLGRRIDLICTAKQETFRGVSFNNCNFSRSNYTQSLFDRCNFSDCSFDEAILDGTIFRGCSFLEQVTMRNALLGGALFEDCLGIEGLVVEDAIAPGIRIVGTGIDPESISELFLRQRCRIDNSSLESRENPDQPVWPPSMEIDVQSLYLEYLFGRKLFDAILSILPGSSGAISEEDILLAEAVTGDVVEQNLITVESVKLGSSLELPIHERLVSLRLMKHQESVSLITMRGSGLFSTEITVDDKKLVEGKTSFLARNDTVQSGNLMGFDIDSDRTVLTFSGRSLSILTYDDSVDRFNVSQTMWTPVPVADCALITAVASKRTEGISTSSGSKSVNTIHAVIAGEDGSLYLVRFCPDDWMDKGEVLEYMHVGGSVDFIKYDRTNELLFVIYEKSNVLVANCPAKEPGFNIHSQLIPDFAEVIDLVSPAGMPAYAYIIGWPKITGTAVTDGIRREGGFALYSLMSSRLVTSWVLPEEELSEAGFKQQIHKLLEASSGSLAGRQLDPADKKSSGSVDELLREQMASLYIEGLEPTFVRDIADEQQFSLLVRTGDRTLKTLQKKWDLGRGQERSLQASLRFERPGNGQTPIHVATSNIEIAQAGDAVLVQFKHQFKVDETGVVRLSAAVSYSGLDSPPKRLGPVEIHVALSSPYWNTGKPLNRNRIGSFYGRNAELEAALKNIEGQKSFALVGARRIGKSSFIEKLANEVDRRFRNPRVFLVHVTCETPWDAKRPFATFINAIANALKSNYPDYFRDIGALQQEAISENSLDTLLISLAEKMERFGGAKFFLAIDEFGLMEKRTSQADRDAIMNAVRAALDPNEYLHCACIIDPPGGTERKSKSPLVESGWFTHYVKDNDIYLGRINLDEATQLILQPLKRCGITMSDELVRYCIRLSGAVPRDIQCLMDVSFKAVVERGGREVLKTDLETAFESVKKFWLESYVEGYLTSLTPSLKNWFAQNAPQGLKKYVFFEKDLVQAGLGEKDIAVLYNLGFVDKEHEEVEVWFPPGLLVALKDLQKD